MILAFSAGQPGLEQPLLCFDRHDNVSRRLTTHLIDRPLTQSTLSAQTRPNFSINPSRINAELQDISRAGPGGILYWTMGCISSREYVQSHWSLRPTCPPVYRVSGLTTYLSRSGPEYASPPPGGWSYTSGPGNGYGYGYTSAHDQNQHYSAPTGSTHPSGLLPAATIYRPKTPPRVAVVLPQDEQRETGRFRNGRGYSEWW